MTDPEGNNKFCFPRISMFRETNPKGPNKTKANFEKRAEIPASTSGHLLSHATAANISRPGNSELFPFDVIVFAMLPAHGIRRETVSLLDVMWL